MSDFPYKQLTLIPVATGLLFGAVELLGRLGSDFVNPHGLFVYLFLLLLSGLTLAGLYVVPTALFRAVKLWRAFPDMRDGTNFLVWTIGVIYVLAIVIGVYRLAAG